MVSIVLVIVTMVKGIMVDVIMVNVIMVDIVTVNLIIVGIILLNVTMVNVTMEKGTMLNVFFNQVHHIKMRLLYLKYQLIHFTMLLLFIHVNLFGCTIESFCDSVNFKFCFCYRDGPEYN